VSVALGAHERLIILYYIIGDDPVKITEKSHKKDTKKQTQDIPPKKYEKRMRKEKK